MSELYIQGGIPLRGRLTVQGAKNCVLPLLAACLLVPGPVELSNCPRLTDVDAALAILRRLGCRAEQAGHTIRVDASGASGTAIPEEQMRAMRSSIIFLGPLLARMGEARMSYPGGWRPLRAPAWPWGFTKSSFPDVSYWALWPT